MAATGHHREDMMAAYHPPDIAGEVARTSSPAKAQQLVHDGRRCSDARHLRVPALDRSRCCG